MKTAAELNAWSEGRLPALLGVEMVVVEDGRVVARLLVREELLAANGYLHGATVVALADTACGYGTQASLPPEGERLHHHRAEDETSWARPRTALSAARRRVCTAAARPRCGTRGSPTRAAARSRCSAARNSSCTPSADRSAAPYAKY